MTFAKQAGGGLEICNKSEHKGEWVSGKFNVTHLIKISLPISVKKKKFLPKDTILSLL